MRFLRKRKRRVCVVGLDGVPCSLLERLVAQGVCPNLARLGEMQPVRPIRASLPEISAVSWSSFMTAADPGTHGIFGFTDLKPDSYDLRFPSFADLRAPTIWDTLGQRGMRSVVINQPATYPARPIPGVLVSGFVAIDPRKAVAPPAALRILEQTGYLIDIDIPLCRADHDALFEQLTTSLEARERAAMRFWESEKWDYFQVVVTGTDRLMHFLWEAVEDEGHARHGEAMDYFARVDRFVGGVRERLERESGERGAFFLLSDHGFTGIRREVNLNAWLARQGYLQFGRDEPESLADIAPSTRAFALDPSRIYLHAKDRYPNGAVEAGAAAGLRSELAAGLKSLEFEGAPVVRQVFEREQIYSGPEVSRGPDLVVLSRPGFDLKGAVGAKEVFGRSDLQGMHTWDDALFWSAAETPPNLTVHEVGRTIRDEALG